MKPLDRPIKLVRLASSSMLLKPDQTECCLQNNLLSLSVQDASLTVIPLLKSVDSTLEAYSANKDEFLVSHL